MTILIKSRVTACAERFQTVMKDGEAYGKALTEGQAAEATEKVSMGWWLAVEGWPIVLSLGSSRPLPPDDFVRGDPVEIRISKGGLPGVLLVSPLPSSTPPPMVTGQSPVVLRRAEARAKGYEGEMCSDCGHFSLVRNGTCLKCDTCGATTGCS